MRLDEVAPLLTAVPTARLTATLSAWRVGQVLDAMVTRLPNVGTATLNVNNVSIDIRSELPLAPGQQLRLEVAHIGAQITLRVLTPVTPKDSLMQALRVLAPRQSALAPVLTELAKAAPSLAQAVAPSPAGTLPTSLAAALATATPELRELAKNIIERIRTPAQTATPEGLKQAIKNAGPFFEQQLATAAGTADALAVFEQDLKAGLLKLASYLRTSLPQVTTQADAVAAPNTAAPRAHTPAPAAQLTASLAAGSAPLETLAKEVDAALARITTQQLLSLPEHGADTPQWIFDLPLRSGERVEVFHLHVFREKHARDVTQPPAWCVRLSFDLVSLGKVGALVTLYAGSVSVSIWAQQSSTARRFEQHLSTLRDELRAAGVVLAHLHCECGTAPFPDDAPLTHNRSGLIDERA